MSVFKPNIFSPPPHVWESLVDTPHQRRASGWLHRCVGRRLCLRRFPSSLRLFFLALAVTAQAEDYTYKIIDGTITITGYTGAASDLVIPGQIMGLPVTSIADSAFTSSFLITSVTIPNTVVTIGANAFYACDMMTHALIGSGVTNIGSAAFSACRNLATITVHPQNASYSSLEGVLLDKGGSVLILCPGGKPGSYVIPDSVKAIEDNGFFFCVNLTNITIPEKVARIGSHVFVGCVSLAAILVKPANPFYTSLDGVLFNKAGTLLMKCPAARGGSYMVPNTVASIADEAFGDCRSLTSVVIPDSVVNIGEYAFCFCTSLTRVTLGNRIATIGTSAFYNCSSLREVCFYGSPPNGVYLFQGADNVTVYYLPGTTGWGAAFCGRPTALWRLPNPVVHSAGLQSNGFTFTISWAAHATVVVEASDSLQASTWLPFSTNMLAAGMCQFNDPDWRNHPARFYRVRSP